MDFPKPGGSDERDPTSKRHWDDHESTSDGSSPKRLKSGSPTDGSSDNRSAAGNHSAHSIPAFDKDQMHVAPHSLEDRSMLEMNAINILVSKFSPDALTLKSLALDPAQSTPSLHLPQPPIPVRASSLHNDSEYLETPSYASEDAVRPKSISEAPPLANAYLPTLPSYVSDESIAIATLPVSTLTTTESRDNISLTFPNTPVDNVVAHKAQNSQSAFRYLDLDQKIQEKIFDLVLFKDQDILPYYRCGMLHHGPWSVGYTEGEMDAGVVHNENVDLSLLRVNKHFNREGVAVYYGKNHFIFHGGEICKWWIKHIGESNFSKIHYLTLSLSTGWNREERHFLDLSQEQHWVSVLGWMRYRHNFLYFHVHISEWRDLTHERWLDQDEKDTLHKFRVRLTDMLKCYRGVRHARLSDRYSEWLKPHEQNTFSMLMQQPREERKPRERVSLMTLIAMCREEARVAEEAERAAQKEAHIQQRLQERRLQEQRQQERRQQTQAQRRREWLDQRHGPSPYFDY